ACPAAVDSDRARLGDAVAGKPGARPRWSRNAAHAAGARRWRATAGRFADRPAQARRDARNRDTDGPRGTAPPRCGRPGVVVPQSSRLRADTLLPGLRLGSTL